MLVGSFQINIVIGILVAYLSNFIIGRFALGVNEWRWMLGVAALPAILFLIMLFGIPRSARWLVTKNRIAEAREVIDSLGSPDGASELDDIIASIHVDGQVHSEPLFQRKYRVPIYLAFTVAAFNQLAGINAILYYLNDIFAMAGFSKVSGDLQAVAVGAMNLLATLLGMSLIDKLGRKTLLMIGGFGMTFCLSGVAAVFYTHQHQSLLVWLLVAYIGFFAISQGAVIWVYISEVFPNRVRSKGQSPGQFHSLDHERYDRVHLPDLRGAFWRRVPIRVLRGHDGADVLRGDVHLPRNQGRHAGRDATQAGNRILMCSESLKGRSFSCAVQVLFLTSLADFRPQG